MEMCEHCHQKPVVVEDYGRNPDVITKYKLCEDCAAMSDAEFFGFEDQTRSGEGVK